MMTHAAMSYEPSQHARPNRRWFVVGCALCAAMLVLWPACTARATEAQGASAPHGLAPHALVGVALMLVVAKLGGELFERFGQSAVLGELLGGILLGNLALLGLVAFEPFKTDTTINALAELGVIVLLFQVGLESSLGELLAVGRSALLAAAAGTCATFLLGWAAAALFLPGAPRLVHLFVGASLCATSIGLTARVLRDLDKLGTREARIILGAAVADDVLSLVVLAVMVGVVGAAAGGAAVSKLSVVVIALKAGVFLVGAAACGRYFVPRLLGGVGRFEGRGVLLAFACAFCLLLAWAAQLLGLAPIIGAFAAGLVLDEVHFERLPRHDKSDLEALLRPLGALLVPLFFVLTGMRVDLRGVARPSLLGFALALTGAALLGKQVCGLALTERKINRLAIGVGMLPRGEVELIFAGVGATLMLAQTGGTRAPVVSPATYGAIVAVVVITTLVTPPLLKWALARGATTDDAAAHTT